MSDFAIIANDIAKKYMIGKQASGNLKETLTEWFSSGRTNPEEEFWALRDISFEIKKGEAVAFIGKNGAGKSTLLKVLSRITEPTTGKIEIEGRVSSLLEVGTGFHPELSGRENIFLNGTILGMKRAEIKAKFDEIVDFSGVEKFLDTPVKRYSSGMKVRLGFAVAAHLEPEILIVDEVLAVGDAEFQKKCLGKMEDVTGQGRTILFVSHNMSAVRNLCSRAIQLSNGQMVYSGDVDLAIDNYMNTDDSAIKSNGEIVWSEGTAPEVSEIKLISARISNSEGKVKSNFDTSEEITIEIDYQVKTPLKGMRVILKINTHDGILAFASTDHKSREANTEAGYYRTVCKIPSNIFNKITYSAEIQFGIPGIKILIQSVKLFEFEVENILSSSGSYFPERWPGVVAIPAEWSTRQASEKSLSDR